MLHLSVFCCEWGLPQVAACFQTDSTHDVIYSLLPAFAVYDLNVDAGAIIAVYDPLYVQNQCLALSVCMRFACARLRQYLLSFTLRVLTILFALRVAQQVGHSLVHGASRGDAARRLHGQLGSRNRNMLLSCVACWLTGGFARLSLSASPGVDRALRPSRLAPPKRSAPSLWEPGTEPHSISPSNLPCWLGRFPCSSRGVSPLCVIRRYHMVLT